MYSSLAQNGVVLSGKELEQYSKRKGLCRICARFVTHKRAGKLWRRNQWQPLTIQDESTGEYLVYKGYCISPTCYTLDQAKEALGEKPYTTRSSFRYGPKPENKRLTLPTRRDSSGSLLSQRRGSIESDSFRGRLSPTTSVHSMSSQRYNALQKWSRDTPRITLPSLANSSHYTGSATPTGTEGDDRNVDKELAGAIANLTSMLYANKKEKETTVSKTPPIVSVRSKSNSPSVASFPSRATQDTKKSKGFMKSIFPGLGKRSKSMGDDSTIHSSSSSIFSDTEDLSRCHSIALPGSGFIAGGLEGNYRAALEALDLADSFSRGEGAGRKDIQAVCLQSKKMDSSDIEIVAVEVDDHNRHWMSQEFVFEEDDFSVWDYDHEIQIKQDLAGLHTVHLSHAYQSGLEELELEADLEDFEFLERVRIEALERANMDTGTTVGKGSSEFLVFRTRVALEIEIEKARKIIAEAEESDASSAIQKGIEARKRLDLLLPLRKFYLSRKELEKKIRLISKAIADLGGNDLDRRYYLATQKEQLVSQVEEEKREERRQRERNETKGTSEPEASQDIKDTDGDVAATKLKEVDIAKEIKEKGKEETKLDEPPPLVSPIEEPPSGSYARNTELSMTVFQSAPLAYVDYNTGTHHVCPLLDFEYEARALTQSLQDAENVGVKVDVQFDIATTDRLSAFLAKSESRVMHLSCHGHPDYLALEDGFGGMQILPVRDLKRFIASGAGNLEVVFVSACHSKAAGKAFLDAGIKHVICCRQDDKFRDEGAIEFARSFYRALALNNTVKQAFKIAREAMRISPMVHDSKAEYEKFILLPEVASHDTYHDVHIFSSKNMPKKVSRRPGTELQKKRTRILPRIPQFFVGREKAMYTILDALRSNDVVSIQGPPEIGKTSLVAAISRYIQQRHTSFLFDDVFWLPVQEGSIPPDDKMCLDLSRIFEMIKRATTSPCQKSRGYADCWGRVLRQLHDKRVLLVVHGGSLVTKASIESLEGFLRDLLRVSSAKVITLGVPVIEELAPSSAVIEVEPLDFDSSVLLFARLTRSASLSSSQIIKSLTTLSSAESNSEAKEKLVNVRRRRMFERIGAGIPAKIRRTALDMSDENVAELLRFAERPLVDVDSRGEIENMILDLEEAEELELKESNFLKARDIQETIEELESLRQDFPTLEQLQEEADEVEKGLKSAISAKQYDDANALKKRLNELNRQISKESSWRSVEGEKEIKRLFSF